jgi:hypothetical protein
MNILTDKFHIYCLVNAFPMLIVLHAAVISSAMFLFCRLEATCPNAHLCYIPISHPV